LKDYSKGLFPISDDANNEIALIGDGFEASSTLSFCTATVNQERFLVVSNQGGIISTKVG
jgi:hypothetical protein